MLEHFQSFSFQLPLLLLLPLLLKSLNHRLPYLNLCLKQAKIKCANLKKQDLENQYLLELTLTSFFFLPLLNKDHKAQ